MIGAQNITAGAGVELVLGRGSTKYLSTLSDGLSPACSSGEQHRCEGSLLVMDPSAANSNMQQQHRIVLVPTVGSVTVATISVASLRVTQYHVIPLMHRSCDPVLITAQQPNTTVVHVMCVLQGTTVLHLVRVTINSSQLSLSSASGSLTQYTVPSLSCLSNMVTTHTPQGALIVFAACNKIVTVSLTDQLFNAHSPLPSTCSDILHIVVPSGHPTTALVYCNATWPIYYDIDNEGPSNTTVDLPPLKIPTPCADPLVMMEVIPAVGNIEYRSWAAGSCTNQLSVSDSQLLSWQCLGDHEDIVIPFSTHSGLSIATINLTTNVCVPHSNITIVHDTDCSNAGYCRPLTTIGDRYLAFQSRNGNLYDINIYCVGPTIQPIATINNANPLVLLTVLNVIPPTPSPLPSSSTLPSSLVTPSPTMLLPPTNNNILVPAILVPLLLITAAAITIVVIVYVCCHRQPPKGAQELQFGREEQGPSQPSASCPAAAVAR